MPHMGRRTAQGSAREPTSREQAGKMCCRQAAQKQAEAQTPEPYNMQHKRWLPDTGRWQRGILSHDFEGGA